MPFTAIMNTPGYLPWSDEPPPVFDTAAEAWSYLAEQRGEQEESAAMAGSWTETDNQSTTLSELEALSRGEVIDALTALVINGTGTIYGGTPGYGGDHDLGMAYSVTEAEGEL